jgi:hypothetical protein
VGNIKVTIAYIYQESAILQEISTFTISQSIKIIKSLLSDVQIIPAAQKPMALGFQTEEIAQLITLEFLPQMA